jgi:hypothetical protein
MFLSTEIWEKPLVARQSLRISKKILSYGSVSSRIPETTLLQISLTYRLSSFRIFHPLSLYDTSAMDRDDGRSIEPDPVPDPVPDPEPEPAPVDDFGWGSMPKKAKKPKKLSKSSLLRQSLHDQLYDTEIIRTLSAARCEVRQNSDPTEDYTTVFLGHAQLYVFAEKWDIKSLKTLALFKLHKTLTSFTLYAARRPDIVELLRYTFSTVDAVDDLRSLVMLYTACEVENLIHCPEFLSLLGEGGQLAQNLVQMLMKRIS